jgi:CheY-like chemotaxis protein
MSETGPHVLPEDFALEGGENGQQRGMGFLATAFTDPLEALQSAKTERPDVLVTDVIMPNLNGIDLASQFKALYPNCKILLFSGMSNYSEFFVAAYEAGMRIPVLSKPLHPVSSWLPSERWKLKIKKEYYQVPCSRAPT